MTTAIAAAALVVLVAARFRPRPRVRRPDAARTASTAPHVAPAARRPLRARWRGRSSDDVSAGEVAMWCATLARAARSGSTLTEAIRSVEAPASCRTVLDGVSLALARGSSLKSALDVRTGSPHLTLALGVLQACAINGGPPAEPLDRAANTLRARAMSAAERRTHSAQARLSAVVMTVLPIAMLVLLIITSSATRSAVASGPGAIAVGVGAVLNVAGWRWMRHLIEGGST